MSTGHIYVADHNGVFVIRMEGDVRLTLCISFDQFITAMFSDGSANAIVFDLRDAVGIDSTTLGLMAKISIGAKEHGLATPVVVVGSEGMVRLLESMGFDDIFDISRNLPLPESGSEQVLNETISSEEQVKQTVLEAHQILMDLNDSNKVKFHELVETLQNKQ